MRNNFLLVIVLTMFSNCVMTQHVHLQRNNTYHTLKIRLPKMMRIDYASDSTYRMIKAKAIAYTFPYLTLLDKRDTMILDVRKIVHLNYKPIFSAGYVVLMFPVTLFSGAFIGVAFADPVESGFIVPFIMGGILGDIDYNLYKEANKKLNTRNIWSFY